MDVDAEHRDTIEHIFNRPSSGNVEWRRVRSLLEAAGSVEERSDGKLEVSRAARQRCSSRRMARTSTRRCSSTFGEC